MEIYDMAKMNEEQKEKYRSFLNADANVQGHIHAGLRSANLNSKSYVRWNNRTMAILAEERETAREQWLSVAPTPMSGNEALIATANGHEDNASVQAARRICAKRGIIWSR